MNISNNNIEKKEAIKLAIEEYLNSSEENKSLTKIGRKFGVKRQTLSNHLKKMGYEVINYQNKARLNETLFDIIDTEEKAYWLGFLYADGCIDSTGNRIEVRLSLKDLEHLEKFKKFLNLKTEIRTGISKSNGKEYLYCHLSVRNKHMWESLNKLGCNPVKSLTLKFPDKSYFSKKELIVHFMRGYVDGDGCLCIYKSSTSNSLRTILSLVGTESFLNSFNEICQNKGRIKNKSTKNYVNQAFQLTFGDVISRKIARLLYQNASVYLDRKYNKYLEFCRLEEESSLRKSSKIGESCDANAEVISEITKGSETL